MNPEGKLVATVHMSEGTGKYVPHYVLHPKEKIANAKRLAISKANRKMARQCQPSTRAGSKESESHWSTRANSLVSRHQVPRPSQGRTLNTKNNGLVNWDEILQQAREAHCRGGCRT
jgi:hypothetical protein